MLTSLSHVLLVVNSSVNLSVYCLWNGQFRRAAGDAFLRTFMPATALRKRKEECRQKLKVDTVLKDIPQVGSNNVKAIAFRYIRHNPLIFPEADSEADPGLLLDAPRHLPQGQGRRQRR